MITKKNYLKPYNQKPINQNEYDDAMARIRRGEEPLGRLKYAEIRDNKLLVHIYLSNGVPKLLRVIVDTERDRYLQLLYDEPQTFSTSREAFYNHVKQNFIGISKRYAFKWLQKQEAYQLHRRVRKPKDITRIVAKGALYKIQVDLIVFPVGQTKHYLINAIDVFSKYACSRYMANKTARTTKQKMIEILDEYERVSGEQVRAVQSDNGKEFLSEFHSMLEERGINHIYSQPGKPMSNGQIERFNAILKRLIFSYLTHSERAQVAGIPWRILDIIRNNNSQMLQEFIHNYNHLINKSTGYSPISMLEMNDWVPMYKATLGSFPMQHYDKTIDTIVKDKNEIIANMKTSFDNPPRLVAGDRVRIALQEQDAIKYNPKKYKSYLPQWSDEIYTVRTSGKKRTTFTDREGSVNTMYCQKIYT